MPAKKATPKDTPAPARAKQSPKTAKPSPSPENKLSRKILRMRITLQGSDPSIWREVEFPENTTLAELHFIVMGAMGWMASHMHLFIIQKKYYPAQDEDPDMTGISLSEEITRVIEVFPAVGSSGLYIYDLGDDWRHELMVTAINDPEPEVLYPRCVAGENPCPPEDSGGIYRYYDILDALEDPEHTEHDCVKEWLEEILYEPVFSLNAANLRIMPEPKAKKTKPRKPRG